MSDSMSFLEKLSQTIADGKIDISIVNDFENLETVDEETASKFDTDTHDSALDIFIKEESILSKLDDENQGLSANRYETVQQLRSNNSDEIVLNLKDANLNRSVEARVLTQNLTMDSEDAGELIHEALILSYLDHPGIPPVYDLDLSSNQQIYCTMKKIQGFPLSVLTSDIDDDDQELSGAHKYDTVTDIVEIFLKIADIVAYAHSRQIIHRNLKPEYFMVGDFGEVYVVGWNAARDLEHDEPDDNVLRGTPLYMSPEQAACQEIDKRSDIYSLGASLYHILLKRPPLMREKFDEFWTAKKDGVVDEVKEHELTQVPAPLLAICKRCLTSDPDKRYQSVDEFIVDLKQYQSGHMVDVYKYGTSDLIKYWVKHNAMHIKWAFIMLLMAAIAGGVYYQMHLLEQSGWGSVIYEEKFDKGDAWREHWVTRETGDLHVEDGRLVTRNGPEFIWYYKKRLHGGVAIEFEGEMMEGGNPGDLSIVYSPDIENMAQNQRGEDVLYLQHGAVGNACSMIEGPNGRLDYVTLPLKIGQKYKIRGEIDGKKLRLFLDDELVCAYDLLFPVNSGYIGIYAYYDEKAIDNIKIYNRELPRVTNIIKTGDLLFENNLFELAAERYQKISELYPNSEIGRESEYKLGLCKYNLEDIEGAFEIWDTLKKSEFATQINFYRWNELVKAQDYNELLRQMYAMYRSANPRLQTQIREQWGIFLKTVREDGKIDLTREFLRFREKNFPDDQIFALETSYALDLLEEPEKSIAWFPDQDVIVTRALGDMGEYQKIISDYSHMYSSMASSLRATGQQERVIKEYTGLPSLVFSCLLDLGRFDEAEKRFGNNWRNRMQIMKLRGQHDQLLKTFTKPEQQKSIKNDLLIHYGKAQEYLDAQEDPEFTLRSVTGYDMRTTLAFERYVKGDNSAISEMYDHAENAVYYQRNNSSIIFQVKLLPDILLHFNGTPEPLKRTLGRIWSEKKRVMGMRFWHNVGLVSGELDKEAFMKQPNQNGLEADYSFYKALYHDLKGEKKEALRLYQAYNEIPLYKNRSGRSLTKRKFITYRIEQLK